MRQNREVQIEDRVYVLHQVDGMQGVRILHRLSSVLGPTIAGALGALAIAPGTQAVKIGDQEIDPTKLGGALNAFFDRLPEESFVKLVQDFLATATVQTPEGGKGLLMPQFNLLMAGRTGDVLQLVKEAFELNFGPLSVYLGGLLRQQMAKMAAPGSGSNPPKESPGPAGA